MKAGIQLLHLAKNTHSGKMLGTGIRVIEIHLYHQFKLFEEISFSSVKIKHLGSTKMNK